MDRPRVGIVGLGNIAQKAYIPILTKQDHWELAGAFSPNSQKREEICGQYRMRSFSSLEDLSRECDVVFVHSSTASHYQVVSSLLKQGKHVFVDKPLAATTDEAEQLASLSDSKGKKLMVGFNRRFAPFYVKAKEQSESVDWVVMEKHRADSVGPGDFAFTMLDDYLHLVDTVRWLGGNQELKITDSFLKTNQNGQLLLAKHNYRVGDRLLTTAMHRQSGSNAEKLELMNKGSIMRVLNLNNLEIEKQEMVQNAFPPSWETILKTKGFQGAVEHFLMCVETDSKPEVDGWEALKSQLLVQEMIDNT
ncbi:Gfo/Idh/MocA family protein [Sediminibacillus massiliensis]|uniref:Gfo/Idh/MocA family protein n=1 Tax=Sediminibacillus massiliensis TaxID=1926277 RepID=UPI0009887DB2|nr:Gfo/Idh/MocA family oxidoreductase [Sediminibacillus massiliensis]